ncbi:transcription factor IIIC subunit delta N-term-domain-containing protein [Paraphysoderma sedebokerense]|nr:transcription factor IIIC subunit delta N-term-domain-containing protein [Paraphysoderma sedebokerense]
MTQSLSDTIAFKSQPAVPDSLLWSEDNQLAVITNNAIEILSPKCRKSSTQLQSPCSITVINAKTSATSQDNDEDEEITSRSVKVRAQRSSSDLSVRSNQYLSEGFRMAAWSPRGCTNHYGCYLAAITHSHRIPIYEPLSLPDTMNWTESYDLCEHIYNHYNPNGSIKSGSIKLSDQYESISIAWSPVTPKDELTPRQSIIAVGAKNGNVTLWSIQNVVALLGEIDVGQQDGWVTRLAWGPWKEERNRLCYSHLVTASSGGAVKVYGIEGLYADPAESSTERNNVRFKTSLLRTLVPKDGSPVTVMKWFIPVASEAPCRLAIAKGMECLVWTPVGYQMTDNDTQDDLPSLQRYDLGFCSLVGGNDEWT